VSRSSRTRRGRAARPDRLIVRPGRAGDREAIVALGVAEEESWFGTPEHTAAEVEEYLDFFGGPEAGVVADDGAVLGYAVVSGAGHTMVFVDVSLPEPPFAPLIDWLVEHGGRKIEIYAGDTLRLAWFKARGWVYDYSAFDLGRSSVAPLEPPTWPESVAVTAYDYEVDAEAVHRLVYVDAQWSEVRGHTERSLESWLGMRRDADRGWVARRGDRPVGWVTGRVFDDGRGWIRQIAVARDERRRGLGRALLLHAFADLAVSGATSFGLSVQAENEQAIGLYRSVGLAITREYRIYVAP
jgi:ribosomal protein S18 acetylase RimI-like enzyme